jgi:RNA polymerase sigma-70 factor (ECF subfamily)
MAPGDVADVDAELVRRFLARRDETTFRALYRRHTPRLYLLALRLVGGARSDADDAIQETWVRACAALPEFGWRSSLGTWLGGFVVNCCREILRRRLVSLDDDALEDAAAPVPPRPEGGDDVEALIARLPARCRAVFVLYAFEGCTHEEIAERLAIATGTSKHQLYRARQTLRGWLGGEG